MLNPLCAGVVAFLGLVALTGRGENWPEFRGPTAQGHSTARHLPTEWSHASGGTSKNIAWRQAIPGKGWSSPVLFKDRILLTTAAQAEGSSALSLRTLCLDAGTGKLLWNAEIFSKDASSRIHTKNSHASSTPVIEGQRVYVHFGHHGTACLDLAGKVIWRSATLSYSPVHGNGGSPVMVDDALIFSCDGATNPFVAALNKHDGKLIWKTRRETDASKKFSFSTPLVIIVQGQKQVVSSGSGAVCAYEPRTGREIWRARYGQGYSVIPRPVFGHGLVFISTGYDRPAVMAIRADGSGDVTATHVAWTLAKGAPNTPSLLLAGEELYMVSDGGIASGVEARSGKVHWQERLGGNYSASPLLAEGKIYFQNEEGAGVVLRAGKQFERLATNPLHERTLASYAAGDGALFIRGEEHLYKVQAPGQKAGP